MVREESAESREVIARTLSMHERLLREREGVARARAPEAEIVPRVISIRSKS